MKHTSIHSKYKHIDMKYIYEQNAKIYDRYAVFLRKLKKSQKDALQQYKDGFYDINLTLTKQKYPDINIYNIFRKIMQQLQDINDIENLIDIFLEFLNKPIKQIHNIDSVFQKIIKNNISHKLEIPLFRGIKKRTTKMKKGTTITFSEYLSTTISPSVAFDFQGCGRKPCCIFIFHTNGKIPYIPLNGWKLKPSKYDNFFNDECEILLPRSTSWKIIDKYKVEMDYNSAIKCTYSDIDKSKHRNITVYELEALPYNIPESSFTCLDKESFYSYNYESKRNKIPFLVMNALSIHQPEKDKIARANIEKQLKKDK